MNDAGDVLQARRLLITEGPLPSVMRRLVVPSAIWYLLNYAFFIVDAFFVAKLGTTELAAMSLIFAVSAITITVAQGMGSALAAITSIYLGARMHVEAARLVTHTLLLSVLVAMVVALLGLPTIEPFFQVWGATPEQMVFVHEFMPIWYMGFGFLMVSTVAQSAIRATGDVKTPLWILLGTGALNVVLDPLLLFGHGPLPALGIQGVAIAGVVSRALAAVIGLWIVGRRDQLLRISDALQPRASWVMIGRIAGPVVVQMGSLALTGVAILGIAASLGPEVVAAVGVGLRIDSILSALVMGLAIILPTFIGQNAGAGKPLRAGEGVVVGMRQVVVAQALIALAVAVAASSIGAAFSDDLRIRHAIWLFMLVVPIGHSAYALLTTSGGTLIALGRMRSYLVLGLAPCVVSIALIWLGARMFGEVGMIVALPLARAAAGIVAWSWIKGELRTAGMLAPLTPAAAAT
jgi:putative MATE family efflux protein